MHLALTLNPLVDSDLLFSQQLGINWIKGQIPIWDYDTLASVQNRVDKAGLYLGGLTLPVTLMAEVLMNQPDNERAIDRICQIISDAGRVGIPSLDYSWPINDSQHVISISPTRGNAKRTTYRIQDSSSMKMDRVCEVKWHLLSNFLLRVIPVAETAGVRLVYHTDISIASLPEDQRILDSVNELDRLFCLAPSPYHGMDLDHGFLTQVLAKQADLQPEKIILQYCKEQRIFAVRMRSLQRTKKGAEETFLDDDKKAIMEALLAYKLAGYKGPLYPSPSPTMTDDTEWGHKGYAFNIGYLRGLLQAIALE